MTSTRKKDLSRATRAPRDVPIIVALCILVLLASKHFDVFENLSSWVLKYRATGVDEVVTTLVFLAFALVVYAFRRSREAALELTQRTLAEGALVALQGELESRVQQRTEDVSLANDALLVEVAQHARTLADLRFQNTVLQTERDLMLDGVLVVDDSSRVLSFNRRFAEMWGISGEMIGARANVDLLQAVSDKLVDPVEFMDLVRRLYAQHDHTSRDNVELTDGRTLDRYSAPMSGPDGKYHGRVWYFRDVTEREQAEEVREHREMELRESQRIAGIGSWEWTIATGAIVWSDGLNYLLAREGGVPAPTFEALPQFYTPESWGRLGAVIAGTIETGVPYELELEMIRADGATRWTTTRGEAIRGPDGTVAKLRGTVHDVTERKREEEAREHREMELREAQRIAGIGSWEWAVATGTIIWSDGLNYLLAREGGVPAPTFEALPQFYTPESWGRLGAVIAGTIETGAPYELELEMIRADGATCWTTTRGEAIRGPDGTVVKLRGTVHDITRRKRAEEAMRLQSAALHAAADAIVITDRQGTIQWTNPAFEALTGFTSAEAVGRNSRVLKSGVHDQAFYKTMWDTILGGHVWRGEMTNRRKDGSLYSEQMTVTPVDDAFGEITHFIAIKRDLTEEKRAEARFLQSQKMEVVGRLAGGVAHDFNNLLTVINGTAELGATGLPEDDPRRADFEEILRAGVRATSLTRQLLAFSRKQVLHPEVLNLNRHVVNLRSMLQRLIGEDIALVVSLAPGEGSVRVDAGQFEQVVMNLVVNARDAMPNGGGLTITTESVELNQAQAAASECPQPGPYVRLSVSDTGVGMDDVTRRRIFEPFFTTKEQGKGTGLGLATVYGIVTQSGGGISVDSTLGHGSTITVYLPRVADAVASQPPAPASSAAATGTILLVEDEDGVRHLAQRMLESFGYTVLTARDADGALRILEHRDLAVQLMLTDVVMPRMSGPELAARVATIRPEIKILFSSGHTDNAALRDNVLDDEARFIGKPYTKAELMRKVRGALVS